MSHWNLTEKQLRSWTPRTPSPKLKAALFGQAQPTAHSEGNAASAARTRFTPPWQWLAPAMALFLFGVFLSGGHAGLHPAPVPSLLATASLKQPEFSTYYASVRHSENNALRNTFEWTNGNGSLSTAPPMAQTNRVMH